MARYRIGTKSSTTDNGMTWTGEVYYTDVSEKLQFFTGTPDASEVSLETLMTLKSGVSLNETSLVNALVGAPNAVDIAFDPGNREVDVTVSGTVVGTFVPPFLAV